MPNSNNCSGGGGVKSKKPKSAREPVEKTANAPYGYKTNGEPRKFPVKGTADDLPIRHTCCGSKGKQHKKICTDKGIKKAPAPAPGHKRGRPVVAHEDELKKQDLRCGDCEQTFEDVYFGAVCPKCESTNIYKMPI